MKANIKITEVTHDDLVNLFSTALYSNPAFDCDYSKEDRDKVYENGDCYEDIIAKILLGGGSVNIVDGYSESEEDIYGRNKNAYYDKETGFTVYPITLLDVVTGLELAAKNDEAERVMMMCNDDLSFDMCDADILMQYITYGKIIY